MPLSNDERATIDRGIGRRGLRALYEIDPSSPVVIPSHEKLERRALVNAIDAWLDSNATAEAEWLLIIRRAKIAAAHRLMLQRDIDLRASWLSDHGSSLLAAIDLIFRGLTGRDFLTYVVTTVVIARAGGS